MSSELGRVTTTEDNEARGVNSSSDEKAHGERTATMRARVKRMDWKALTDADTGDAVLVVPPGTSSADALRELVAVAHGAYPPVDNAALVREANRVTFQAWRSCTKAWREAEGVDFDTYWSPDGDGLRRIVVAIYAGDLFALGDEIESSLRLDGNQ